MNEESLEHEYDMIDDNLEYSFVYDTYWLYSFL